MGRSLNVGLALALAASSACDREPSAPPAEPSASEPANPPPAKPVQSRVVGESAFDLTTQGDGAALVFAKPSQQGSAIALAILDAAGAERGEKLELARGGAEIVEVAAAATRAALAATWLERRSGAAELMAVLADPTARSFGTPIHVSPASTGSREGRGHIALAGDGDRLLAFYRADQEPCQEDASKPCTRLGFAELVGESARPRRIPLSVPSPCASAIAGYVVAPGLSYYAVCSHSGGHSLTTAFRIQYEPRYAEAHEALAGCTPTGMVAIGDDVLVTGECKSGRRAARVGRMATAPKALELGSVRVSCSLGHPELRAGDDLALTLREPMSGLAPLLPAEIAPLGARAVWTGTTLLVARWVAGNVVLHRYACRGAELARLG